MHEPKEVATDQKSGRSSPSALEAGQSIDVAHPAEKAYGKFCFMQASKDKLSRRQCENLTATSYHSCLSCRQVLSTPLIRSNY